MPLKHDANWKPPQAVRDRQSITRDWQPSGITLIEGVTVIEVKNVASNYGYLTEIFRKEWLTPDDAGVEQIFQSVLEPGAISAWHAHEVTTDRLFVSLGRMRIVLYDGRERSPTHGRLNEFRFGTVRPALVVVPPRVWHGVQNISTSIGVLLNAVNHAYEYERPDHYRLPLESDQIPYRFQGATQDALRAPLSDGPQKT